MGRSFKPIGERRRSKTIIEYTDAPPMGLPWISPVDGTKRCGAKVFCDEFPESGRRCYQWAGPKGRCKVHGGRSIGRPMTNGQGSRWRESLPERLRAGFDSSKSDKDLQGLSAKLSILDSLLMDKLSQLGDAPSRERWNEARRQLDFLKVQLKGSGIELGLGVKDALGRLERVIRDSQLEGALELDVRGLIQEATSVSKVELERMKLLGKFMPEGQVNVIIAGMSSAVTGQLGKLACLDKSALVADIERASSVQEWVDALKKKIQLDFIQNIGIEGPDASRMVSELPQSSSAA